LGILYQLQQAEAAALEQNLIPVAYLGSVQQALVASKKSNLTAISDIQNTNRALFYGSSVGVGSANYLAGRILFDQLKKEMIQVPYKGEADALNAVLADTVDLVFITAKTALQYRDRLEILGVTGAAVGDVQSLSTNKLENFDQSLLQLVLFANSTADPQTIKKIQNALHKTYFSNEKDNYISAGLDIETDALLTAGSFFVVQVPKLKSILVNLKID
jgi:ABC-type amino acid transport substrate-binding protein